MFLWNIHKEAKSNCNLKPPFVLSEIFALHADWAMFAKPKTMSRAKTCANLEDEYRNTNQQVNEFSYDDQGKPRDSCHHQQGHANKRRKKWLGRWWWWRRWVSSRIR